MDERRTLTSARSGDLNAFNRLISAHQDTAYNLAFHLLGGEPASDVAVKKAVMTAHQTLGAYRGFSFRLWFLRIVIDACSKVSSQQSSDPTPIFRKGYKSGSQFLGQLPFEYRAVLILVDFLDLTYAESAELLDTSVAELRARLAQARARFIVILPGNAEMVFELS